MAKEGSSNPHPPTHPSLTLLCPELGPGPRTHLTVVNVVQLKSLLLLWPPCALSPISAQSGPSLRSGSPPLSEARPPPPVQ